MSAHQEIASKLQAQGTRQEDLIGELQSRLAEFSTLPVRTKQLEEVHEAVETRLSLVEEQLEGLKEATTKECVRLKEMQDQLRADVERDVKTQFKELQEKVFKEISASQEVPKKELMEETSGSTHISSLRPTAPEFSPHAGSGLTDHLSSPGASVVASDSPARPAQQQRPPTYDGKTAWDAFKMQFEMLAQINKWTTEEKSAYLAVGLRGPALAVLSNMPADKLYDYDTLVSALEARFGNAHQSELHKMKLRGRIRRREETLAELAEDIEYLTRLAYPDAAPAMQESLAKDQFIDSLLEEDMRLKIRQSQPKSLRDAVELALELEAFQLASRQRVKTVRGAAMETPIQTEVSADDVRKQMMQCMQQCVDAMLNRTAEENSGPRGRRTRRGPGGRKEVKCWSCGQLGHFQRDCPETRKDADHLPTTPTTSQPQSGNDN